MSSAEVKGAVKAASLTCLFIYNSVQSILWMCVLVVLGLGVTQAQVSTVPFLSIGMCWVMVLQLVAGIEIVFVVLGMTKGSLLAAILQWAGRSHCILVAVRRMISATASTTVKASDNYEDVTSLTPGTILKVWKDSQLHGIDSREKGVVAARLLLPAIVMALAWTLSEIVRYPHYAAMTLVSIKQLSQKNKNDEVHNVSTEAPKWLEWLRYSCFIPLYPIGLLSEMTCLYSILSFPEGASVIEQLSIRLPNAWNMSFDYGMFIRILLITYVPMWLNLYSYMFKQRNKKLSPAVVKVHSS